MRAVKFWLWMGKIEQFNIECSLLLKYYRSSNRNEDEDMVVHFALHFDPYAGLVSTADLHSILMEEITSEHPKHFANITIDPNSLQIKEVLGQLDDIVGTSASPLGVQNRNTSNEIVIDIPPRQCVPLSLNLCKSVGYNMTTYPNYFGNLIVQLYPIFKLHAYIGILRS